jgi:type VI secretion system protein ImpA
MAADLDLDALLAPLDDAAPCGPDLEYDADFLAMQATGEGKPERQYGDTVIPAEEPDWPVLREQALKLAQRTRDLRVAVWLARSGARVGGLGSAVRGLQLVHGLLERHWDHVHPLLDASDNNDPTARLNALAPLSHLNGALADFRAATLASSRGSLTVRDLELALGRGEPIAGESVPSEDGALEGVRDALARQPELGELLAAGHAAVKAIAELVDGHVGVGVGPDLAPLTKLLQVVALAGRRAAGAEAAADDDATAQAGDPPAASRGGVSVPGRIATREDAIEALERVCDWIERNEPSNPAPLLIRRAQRLMSKSFLEIIRDLMPEGLDSVEKLAGPGGI